MIYISTLTKKTGKYLTDYSLYVLIIEDILTIKVFLPKSLSSQYCSIS